MNRTIAVVSRDGGAIRTMDTGTVCEMNLAALRARSPTGRYLLIGLEDNEPAAAETARKLKRELKQEGGDHETGV